MGARHVQVDIQNPSPLVDEESAEIVVLVSVTSRTVESRAGADVHPTSSVDVDGVGGGGGGLRVLPRHFRRSPLELLFHRHHPTSHSRSDARFLINTIITIDSSVN